MVYVELEVMDLKWAVELTGMTFDMVIQICRDLESLTLVPREAGTVIVAWFEVKYIKMGKYTQVVEATLTDGLRHQAVSTHHSTSPSLLST